MKQNIIILSYYHPWVAGGGHRHVQLTKENLKNNDQVVFIFCSEEEIDNINKYKNLAEYKYLSLYKFDDNNQLKIISNPIGTSSSIYELCKEFSPHYIRAHHPVEVFRQFINFVKTQNITFIYDQMDDWSCFTKQPWGSDETENFYIDSSDLVVTITERLKNKISHYDPEKKVKVIENAISSSFIKNSRENIKVPIAALEKIKKDKIVIYTGALWPDWFDWELCLYLSDQLPNYLFIYIGSAVPPKKEIHIKDTLILANKLASCTNVIMIEEIPHEDLVNWLLNAEVGIIPFKVNQLTLSCSPLKLYDYLAAGLPVVSSNLDQLSGYPEVRLGTNYQEIVDLIYATTKKNLGPNDLENINNFIDTNNWSNRLTNFEAAIKVIKGK